MASTRAVWAIAHKEFSDRLRSRWVLITAVGFTLFSILIAYFGTAPIGVAGFQGFSLTVLSLLSLATYFIPLLALVLGGGVMADERDRGTLDLLLACPVTPGEIVAGKYLGLALALIGATAGGFGAAGAVLVLRMGFAGIGSYVLFTGNAVLLGLVFLGFAFLLSVFIRERSKVMAVSVFLWLVLALLYDLGLIGLLILSGGRVPEGVFAGLLAANPIDLFRLLGFLAVGETKMFVGLAAVDFPPALTWPVLLGVFLSWIAAPLAIAAAVFRRRAGEGFVS